MRDAAEIARLWRYRRDHTENVTLQRMRRVRDAYNGDLVLPFAEETEPAVANLILMGIDQKAGRLASVIPNVHFPPDRRGFKNSEEQAVERAHAVRAWWDDNEMPDILTQRSRHLIAYGRTITLIWPDLARQVPKWKVRNPLASFPADDVGHPGNPSDIIVAHNKPFGWLKQHHPNTAMRANFDGMMDDSTQIVLLEYADAEQLSLVFAGLDSTVENYQVTEQWETDTWGGHAEILFSVENRTGRCPATVAARPTLDREQGEFDQVIGMYGARAKLTALELDAIERDIYPDVYLVSRPGEQARFVAGPFDGRSGDVNIVSGGEIQSLHEPPGWQTDPVVDRIERAERLTSGVPAEFGGESQTNVRTGRRGESIMSAVVDFPLAEGQRALGRALRSEDIHAINTAQAWWGESKVSYFFIEGRKARSGEYVPNELFDGIKGHTVNYPVAGADMNNLIVGIGQRIGLGTMSKLTAAELDPLIDDPEFETDRITSEGLNSALLASVQNAAAEGMLSPQVIGRIVELIRSGKEELPAAIAKATEEEAKRREAEQPQGQPTGVEGQMAQMAAQATGQPEGLPPVQEAGAGLQNLQGLVGALRSTNRPGRAAVGG